MKKQLLDALIKISTEMNSTMELDELLKRIVKISKDYLKVSRAYIILNQNDTPVIISEEEIMKANDTSIIHDEFMNKLVQSDLECVLEHIDTSCKAIIVQPLKATDRISGAFYLSHDDGIVFSEDDVSIARYIASQCALAIERHRMYRKMRESENLQALGLLKSSVAHDISNLLGIADVYLTLMEDEVEKGSAMEEYVLAVKSEIKRVSILATDMMDLSKNKINIHKTKFKVSELINELKMYSVALTKESDIEINFKVNDDIDMTADKNRLFRVFFNLINNSADALEGQGYILMKAKKVGDNITFAVLDNGKGISKENLAKLFQPFFTSGKIKGTGLGLSVVTDIIKAHHGSIKVRSCETKYTCFVVRIPING